MGDTAPFWRFSAASYPDLESINHITTLIQSTNTPMQGNLEQSSGVSDIFISFSALNDLNNLMFHDI